MQEDGNIQETGAPVRPVKGRSPWADAFSRLLKNRMAVAGLAVVILMSLLALLADFVSPFPATYQQLWVGAAPPLFSHPEVLNEMLIAIGEPPEVPRRAKGDGLLRFLVASRKGEDFRLLVRGARVQKITRETGAEEVQSISVQGDSEAVCVVREDSSPGAEIKNVSFEVKKDLPELAGLQGRQGRWVLILRRFTEVREKPSVIEAKVSGGTVQSIDFDGEALDSITIRGRQVDAFEKDGKPVIVTHWLGTDQVGRDVLSRVIFGGRISLLVGLVATLVSLLIGVVYGAASGYFGQSPVKIADVLLFVAVVAPMVAVAALGAKVFAGHPAWWGGLAVTALCFIHGAASVQLNTGRVAAAFLVFAEVAFPAAGHWIFGGSFLAWLAVIPVSQAARFAGAWAGGAKIHPYQALLAGIRGGPFRFLMWPVMSVDNLMMRFVDILYGLPYMFLVILLLVNFGRDIIVLFVALGAVQWLTMARIVRGQVLSLKEKEFIEAARMAGAGHLALLFRHLIPNTLGVVAVYTTLTIPAVILQESFLAFIGLAVQYRGENLASWGALVDEGRQALGSGGANWWMLVFPSLAMAITLFSLNFLGDGLRDALDPQQKGRT